ncbi:MAG: urea amidolyase associated protein UAAP1, partial [Pseudomonadota bacterium]
TVPGDLNSPDGLVSFTGETISRHAGFLIDFILPLTYIWPPADAWPAWLNRAIQILLLTGVGLYLLRFLSGRNWTDRLRLLWPLVFVLIFLALFLPHRMTATGAPRYIIGAWLMFLSLIFALPCSSAKRWLRIPTLVLLAIWSGYHVEGLRRYVEFKRPKKDGLMAEFQQLIDRVDKVNPDFAMILDFEYSQMRANGYTFLVRNRVKYVSTLMERTQRLADQADGAERMAYIAAHEYIEPTQAALKQQQATFSIETGASNSVIHSIRVPQRKRRSIPPDDIEVELYRPYEGDGSALIDRTHETHARGLMLHRADVTLDLGTNRVVSKLTVVPPKPGLYPRNPPELVQKKLHINLNMGTPGGGLPRALYNPIEKLERYNAPDTLKCQHTFKMTKGHCLYSDMGHIFCSITADSLGWHDTVGGNLSDAIMQEKWAVKKYQEHRNDWTISGDHAFMVELAKYGLNRRDMSANLNLFSKVAPDDTGGLSFVENHSQPGDFIDLRFEMNTLVLMHTCPHPMTTVAEYPKKPVTYQFLKSDPVTADDYCMNLCPENQRGFQHTALYHLGSGGEA